MTTRFVIKNIGPQHLVINAQHHTEDGWRENSLDLKTDVPVGAETEVYVYQTKRVVISESPHGK